MKIEVTQCSMCKHYSEEQYCEIWQQYIANDAFYCTCGARADRKTENSSEKPNNCEECKHWNDTEDDCADRHGCRTTTEDWQDWKDRMWAEAIVTEPTTEDCSTVEPQTDCGDFADRLAYERGVKHAWEVAQKVFDSTLTFYEAEDLAKQIDKDINVRSKDEPQTDCNGCKFVGWYDTEFPCANCIRKNKDYYTSEQTERSGE